MLKTVKENTPVPKKSLSESDSENEIYKSDESDNCPIVPNRKSSRSHSMSSSGSRSSRSRSSSRSSDSMAEDTKKASEYKTSHSDADEDLIASIHLHHNERNKKKGLMDDTDSDEMKEKSYLDDNEDFQFDLPFSDISPMNKNRTLSNASKFGASGRDR